MKSKKKNNRVLSLRDMCFPKQKNVVVDYNGKSRTDYQKALWDCWKEIHGLIKEGELQGNGVDETAERNGIIKAANHIACMIDRERESGTLKDKPKENKNER